MIDKKEIERIAKLARLKLEGEELEGFSKDLSSIVNYVEVLKKVKVKGIKPQSYVHNIENVMRNDISFKQSDEVIKNLIDMSPEKESGCIKVKAVLN